MCRLATVCLLILLPAVLLAATDRPRGSGRNVTGGQGKPEWEWKFGEDPKLLKEKMKEGNVYIRLRGKGTLVIDDQYWLIGSNTTLDGTEAQITIQGSKGLWIRQTVRENSSEI